MTEPCPYSTLCSIRNLQQKGVPKHTSKKAAPKTALSGYKGMTAMVTLILTTFLAPLMHSLTCFFNCVYELFTNCKMTTQGMRVLADNGLISWGTKSDVVAFR